jgi:hypothetical protein
MLRCSRGIIIALSVVLALVGSVREKLGDFSAVQASGQASCAVKPNPVPLGTNYLVTATNLFASRPARVRVTEAGLVRTFNLVSNVNGGLSVTVTSQRVGSGLAEVFQFRGNGTAFLATQCTFSVVSSTTSTGPKIPSATAWTDYGIVLHAGTGSEWDHILWGGFVQNVAKIGGRFLFYYQGSRNWDNYYDTIAYGAIGVATSTDGIHFTKYSGNPVIEWLPHNWVEEGAVSAAPTITSTGQMFMFYGANTKRTEWSVNADGRLAKSNDGLVFTDAGIGLNHTNTAIWGYGDELFPIFSFTYGGKYYVYYLPNGTAQSRKLGVAWGSDPLHLSSSAAVTNQSGTVLSQWGTGSVAPLGSGNFAVFLNRGDAVDVWRVSASAPTRFSGPVMTYTFSNMAEASFLLSGSKWYLYYMNKTWDAFGVRTAPAF